MKLGTGLIVNERTKLSYSYPFFDYPLLKIGLKNWYTASKTKFQIYNLCGENIRIIHEQTCSSDNIELENLYDDSLSTCMYVNESLWMIEKYHLNNCSYGEFNEKGKIVLRYSESDLDPKSFTVYFLMKIKGKSDEILKTCPLEKISKPVENLYNYIFDCSENKEEIDKIGIRIVRERDTEKSLEICNLSP